MANRVRVLSVSDEERLVEQRVRAKGSPARRVERARIVLLSAEGLPGKEIGARVGCSEPTVVLWRHRYAEKGLVVWRMLRAAAPHRRSRELSETRSSRSR